MGSWALAADWTSLAANRAFAPGHFHSEVNMANTHLEDMELAIVEVLSEFPEGLREADLYQKVRERGCRPLDRLQARKVLVRIIAAEDQQRAAARAGSKPVAVKKRRG